MERTALSRLEDLKKIPADKRAFVLFVKPGQALSDCALENAMQSGVDDTLYTVDVSKVRDIHPVMGVRSVPTLAVWQNGRVKNVGKGCQSPAFYKKIFTGEGSATGSSNGQRGKRVTVYTTPSCPYCNKLKQYLNRHGVRYTDINVAADRRAAEEMVRKSGQRGVPQTDINGHIVIGFDVPKISKLLNIPTE